MPYSFRSSFLKTTAIVSILTIPGIAHAQLLTSDNFTGNDPGNTCNGAAECLLGTNAFVPGRIDVSGAGALPGTDPAISVDTNTAIVGAQGGVTSTNTLVRFDTNVTNVSTSYNSASMDMIGFADITVTGANAAAVEVSNGISIDSIYVNSGAEINTTDATSTSILLGTGANITSGVDIDGTLSANVAGNALDFSAADNAITTNIDVLATLQGNLVFGQGDTLVFDDANAGAASTLTYNQNITGDTGGGIETLNINAGATDTVVINGNVNDMNNITVTSGTLDWQGVSSGNDNFLINTNGTLKGTGTITTSGALTNNGTYAPGNSIGTQNITGNYVQGAGGTLEIEFDGSGIDLLNISGTATLGGEVDLIELGAGADANLPLTFLQASGGVTGTFATTTKTLLMGSTLADASVGYDATSAFITFATTTSGVNSSTPSNQGGNRVARAINSDATNSPTQATADIINAINGADDVDAALDSQGNIVANTAMTQANGALGQVVNVVRARIGANTVSSVQSGMSSGDVYGSDIAYWSQAVGAISKNDGDASARGYKSTAYGFAVGAEAPLENNETILGIFAGYTISDTDVDGLDDESNVDNYQLGLYGSHDIAGTPWHMNGTLSASYLDFDTERDTALGQASADFDGWGGYASAELLYDINLEDDYKISPFAAVEASVIDRDGYTESGAGVLNNSVEDETNTYLSTVLGIEAEGHYEASDMRFSPSARIGWAHQYLDDTATTRSSFTSAPDISFETQGPERNRNSARLGFDLEVSHADNEQWSAFVRYDGDITSGAQDHMVRIGAGFKF